MSKFLGVLCVLALPATHCFEEDASAMIQARASTKASPDEMIELFESNRDSLYDLPFPSSLKHKNSRMMLKGSNKPDPNFWLRVYDSAAFLVYKQARWGPFKSCKHSGGKDPETKQECQKAAGTLGLSRQFATTTSPVASGGLPASRCQFIDNAESGIVALVWYDGEEDLDDSEQECGEDGINCLCLSEKISPCERPADFCSNHSLGWGSYFDSYDCDGDGLADPMCMDTAYRRGGYVSSRMGCVDNWPTFFGTCHSMVAGNPWPQQCVPFTFCEPQSGLQALQKGLDAIAYLADKATSHNSINKSFTNPFVNPETADPVSCVALGKASGSAPYMPNGCNFCAYQQDWVPAWGRGVRAPSNYNSMKCLDKEVLLQGSTKVTGINFRRGSQCPKLHKLMWGAAYIVCDGQAWCPSFQDQCCMPERNECVDALYPYFVGGNWTWGNRRVERPTAAPTDPEVIAKMVSAQANTGELAFGEAR